MAFSKKKTLFLLIGCVVILAILIGWRKVSKDARANQSSHGADELPLVSATKAVLDHPGSLLQITGEILALRRAEVRAETVGRVVRMDRRVGDFVKKRDILARLDSSKNAIAIEQAEAGLQEADAIREAARRDDGRSRTLFRGEEISEQEFDAVHFAYLRADATRKMRRATLKSLKRNAADYIIRAPFDALVSAIHIEIGDFVNPGSPAFTLVQAKGTKAAFKVPAEHIGAFDKGVRYPIQIPALGVTVPGVVSAIGVEADPRSRTFDLELDIDSKGEGLLAGLIAKLVVQLRGEEEALFVPSAALVEKFGGTYVFLIKEGLAREVPVVILSREGDRAAVSGSLNQGDLVITQGQHALRDGDAVRTRKDS